MKNNCLGWLRLALELLGVLVLLSLPRAAHGQVSDDPVVQLKYLDSRPILLNMQQPKEVPLTIVLDAAFYRNLKIGLKDRNVSIVFEVVTESPQFNILQIVDETDTQQLSSLVQEVKLKLYPSYIGHAYIKPASIWFKSSATEYNVTISSKRKVPVKITENEGIYGDIFTVSVSLFIVLSFVSLGAQLDSKNLTEIVQRPLTVSLGTIATVLVMPATSWLIGRWLLEDQILFQVGSFIFSCGPPASAATLWTTMLDSDKELSVALQVLSTLGSLIAMPFLLYLATYSLDDVQAHTLQVPYLKLIQGLLVIVLALFIGWRFIGRYERPRKISQAIFRPLTFFVLIYIIVFSSVIYWYLYKMFNWTITLTTLLVAVCTCLVSGTLGYLIKFNIDDAIAISISSVYKNSGVAFAVLLVAFENPDLYVAFVPCLTQVVLTSLTLYLVYGVWKLVNKIRRLDQPDPIQATKGPTLGDEERREKECCKAARSGSTSDKSINNDELIAMNVSDCVEPPDLQSLNQESTANAEGAQTKVSEGNEVN